MPKQTVSCPACKARFSASPGQLKVAKGLVRCGACLTVFNALESPRQAPAAMSTAPATKTATPAPAPAPASKTDAHLLEQPLPTPTAKVTVVPPSKDTQELLNIPELPMHDMLDRPQSLQRPSTISHLGYSLAIALALLILLAQVVWFNPALVHQHTMLAPLQRFISQQLNLPPPARRATGEIINERLVIQPHEEYADALRVSLRLINQADFAQAFPALHLSFSDLAGKPVAQRLFQPEDYLDTSLFAEQLMPVQQPVQIQLDILNPGARAVNYQLELRP